MDRSDIGIHPWTNQGTNVEFEEVEVNMRAWECIKHTKLRKQVDEVESLVEGASFFIDLQIWVTWVRENRNVTGFRSYENAWWTHAWWTARYMWSKVKTKQKDGAEMESRNGGWMKKFQKKHGKNNHVELPMPVVRWTPRTHACSVGESWNDSC